MKLAFELDPPRPEGCLSDLTLDRMLADELPRTGPEGSHLAGCETCRSRLAFLQAEHARLASDPCLAAPARRQVEQRRRLVWARRVGAAALALAASVLVVVLVPRPNGPGERTKGPATLGLFARGTDGKVQHIDPGATLHPGDQVRFEVSSSGGHAAVLGADAAGTVSLYVAPRKVPGGRQLLDVAIELDSTLGPEQFVAFVCREPRTGPELQAQVRTALAAVQGDPRRLQPSLPGCTAALFLVEKEPRR